MYNLDYFDSFYTPGFVKISLLAYVILTALYAQNFKVAGSYLKACGNKPVIIDVIYIFFGTVSFLVSLLFCVHERSISTHTVFQSSILRPETWIRDHTHVDTFFAIVVVVYLAHFLTVIFRRMVFRQLHIKLK